MRSWTRTLLLLAPLLFASGCFQSQAQRWLPNQPLPKTREELYARHGPPDVLVRDGENRLLRYDRRRAKGMRFGLSYWGNRLEMGYNHAVFDRAYVLLAPDGRVLDIKVAPYDQEFGYHLWPFGD